MIALLPACSISYPSLDRDLGRNLLVKDFPVFAKSIGYEAVRDRNDPLLFILSKGNAKRSFELHVSSRPVPDNKLETIVGTAMLLSSYRLDHVPTQSELRGILPRNSYEIGRLPFRGVVRGSTKPTIWISRSLEGTASIHTAIDIDGESDDSIQTQFDGYWDAQTDFESGPIQRLKGRRTRSDDQLEPLPYNPNLRIDWIESGDVVLLQKMWRWEPDQPWVGGGPTWIVPLRVSCFTLEVSPDRGMASLGSDGLTLTVVCYAKVEAKDWLATNASRLAPIKAESLGGKALRLKLSIDLRDGLALRDLHDRIEAFGKRLVDLNLSPTVE